MYAPRSMIKFEFISEQDGSVVKQGLHNKSQPLLLEKQQGDGQPMVTQGIEPRDLNVFEYCNNSGQQKGWYSDHLTHTCLMPMKGNFR